MYIIIAYLLYTCAHCENIYLDTFASRTAAIQNEYADSSIGNVTGSNAVNVFLGIGIGMV